MRRFLFLLATAVCVSVPALAQQNVGPVTLAPVSYSPEFTEELDDVLGAREGEYLSAAVTRALAREIAEKGEFGGESAAMIVETTIVDAAPNRPTFKQLGDTIGLDPIRSVSIGGAELHAVLRRADGEVVAEVTHRRYNQTLDELIGPPSTWQAASRAIRQFAHKVADAYAANAR